MLSISGWRITGYVAIVLAVMTAITFNALGFSEDAVREMIRGTARSSVTLFLLAFTASSLYSLFKTQWASYLLRNRRYIGVSFAISHLVHLCFLITLIVNFPNNPLAKLHIIEVVLASVAYVFVLLMLFTSFDGPRRWLGEKRWHLLHTTGMYLVWLIFLDTFGFGALNNAMYIPMVLLLLVAFGLRVKAGKVI